MVSIYTALDSPQRLAALQKSGLLDPSMKPVLDRITKLITSVMKVPVALVSLVSDDRQIFNGHFGLPEPFKSVGETPLSHSFCQHVVLTDQALMIEDARLHPLVKSNSAIPDIGVIAYLGVPLRDDDGFVLGSLSAIDQASHQWSNFERSLLENLAIQITADVQIHQQSTKLGEELLRQQEAEADRRQLTRLNVHDLRTPLAAMIMTLELIKQTGPLNHEQLECLALGRSNGVNLRNLLDNLLDIGNVDYRGRAALRPSECPYAEIMRTAVDQTRALSVEKSIQLNYQIEAAAKHVYADCDKIGRVLVNLLANAIKFTPDGGNVDLQAADDVIDGPTPAVRFIVRDNGIGIEKGDEIFLEGAGARRKCDHPQIHRAWPGILQAHRGGSRRSHLVQLAAWRRKHIQFHSAAGFPRCAMNFCRLQSTNGVT